MERKKDKVIRYVNERKYKEALSICKCWNLPISHSESETLRRAYECINYPDFYRQLGYNTELEIEKAIEILERVYKL